MGPTVDKLIQLKNILINNFNLGQTYQRVGIEPRSAQLKPVNSRISETVLAMKRICRITLSRTH